MSPSGSEKKKNTPAAEKRGGCFTYILRCADGSLYTGWTKDLEKRIETHNAGLGAKYTRSRRPVELAYFEELATKEEAMRREAEIKRLSRAEKEEIIGDNNRGRFQ